MKSIIPALVLGGLLAAGAVSTAVADQRPDHFDGVPAPTLEAALANLREFNPQLETLLASGELTPEDMHHVHRLSYTLENALETLRAELADTAADLEALHLASETNEPDTVRARGRAYLETLEFLRAK